MNFKMPPHLSGPFANFRRERGKELVNGIA